MRRWVACAGMIAVVAPAVAAAAPDGEVRWLSLPAQPLSASLQAIARRYGIELLFSHSVVGSRSAPPVADRLSAQATLNRVLEGSGLVANRTADGSFIVTAAPVAASEQADATPELLVVGRRTQNTDVRRTRNDVRPYQVITRADIATAHVATLEELAARRLPANNIAASLAQQGPARRDRRRPRSICAALAPIRR